jgi:hypothetical protein
MQMLEQFLNRILSPVRINLAVILEGVKGMSSMKADLKNKTA